MSVGAALFRFVACGAHVVVVWLSQAQNHEGNHCQQIHGQVEPPAVRVTGWKLCHLVFVWILAK